MRALKLFVILALCFVSNVFVHCSGVKYSLSGATIPPEAKTISVAWFTNNTTLAAPTTSQRFTERLRDMVSTQTNLALVKQNGDLQFEGYISNYNVAPVSIQSIDQAAMNRLTMTVNVKYTNRFDEKQNFEQEFTRFADFPTSDNLATRENDLLTEINRQITEDIFNRAFNNW